MSAGRWLCRGEHYLEQVVLIFFVLFFFFKAVENTRKSDGKGIFLGEGGGEVVCRDLRGRWRGRNVVVLWMGRGSGGGSSIFYRGWKGKEP